jgi:hypothetical protein
METKEMSNRWETVVLAALAAVVVMVMGVLLNIGFQAPPVV